MHSPGFIIVPSDLEYFIEYERIDYSRRLELLQYGYIAGRSVPSTADYRQHQVRNGTVREDECGGMYQRIILRNFFSPFEYPPSSCPSPVPPRLPPRSWHGAPLAPLLRTFMVHGSPVVGMEKVSVQTRQLLRTLQDLYIRPDPDLQEQQAQEIATATSALLARTAMPAIRSTSDTNKNHSNTDASAPTLLGAQSAPTYQAPDQRTGMISVQQLLQRSSGSNSASLPTSTHTGARKHG
jgi:hypothetical protein